MRICTQNVRTFYRLGAVGQLLKVICKYKAYTTALQEIRWTGHGGTNLSSCDVYYSGHASWDEFGCGFAERGDLKDIVSRFTAVDERLAAIGIKAKYF